METTTTIIDSLDKLQIEEEKNHLLYYCTCATATATIATAAAATSVAMKL